MPRALKVFKTHLGFHDLIVAAPSMKAAAAAWDSDTKIFAQGFAAQTQEPQEIRVALAQPGIVLRRPHGQKAPYQVHPSPIAQPEPDERQKRAMTQARKVRNRREAEKAEAQAVAAHKARQDARTELEEIERQEAELRQKRLRLQKKFHLRRVK